MKNEKKPKKPAKPQMTRLQVSLPTVYVKAMDKRIEENPQAYPSRSALIRFALDVMP